ncbi:MAG: SAM-dependent methyltransferase, partial [Actinomycetales bacterium]|nr:SAM-dependent methyltransferase [Actinomycetales bacterium]
MEDDQAVSGLVQLARTPLPERQALLTSALSLPTLDPLAAVNTLRREHPDLHPSVCSALVTQQQLLLAGADRGLIDATGLWMTTPVGLEQASRPQVALRRASLLASAGIRSVVDATAGIGV